MAKQIVILGGGFAGIPLAHKLLKYTIPKVKESKLILVSASTHLYWNLAAVRAVVPDQIPEDQLFRPIKEGFAKYPASQFELVFGKATSVDFDQNSIIVDVDGSPTTINYDQLILATGSSIGSGLPLKHIGSSEATKTALRDLQAKIKAAKSIVIAGDGPTGVETAGEIAHAFGGKKELTFIVSKDHALPGLMPSVGKAAEKELTKMSTTVIHNATVTDVKDLGASKSLTLSNGKTLSADVYLPLFGLRPNSSYVPSTYLDSSGNVKLDLTLRVSNTKNVWGVGDIGNLETKQVMKAEPQVIHLAKNLDAVLTGNSAGVTEYKTSDKPMIFITIGKSKGTGQMGGMKPFSWLVSYMKGRTLFVEKAPPLIEGKAIIQASI